MQVPGWSLTIHGRLGTREPRVHSREPIADVLRRSPGIPVSLPAFRALVSGLLSRVWGESEQNAQGS